MKILVYEVWNPLATSLDSFNDQLIDSMTQFSNIDYEASFLRLLEKLTNGSTVEISYTGMERFRIILFTAYQHFEK